MLLPYFDPDPTKRKKYSIEKFDAKLFEHSTPRVKFPALPMGSVDMTTKEDERWTFYHVRKKLDDMKGNKDPLEIHTLLLEAMKEASHRHVHTYTKSLMNFKADFVGHIQMGAKTETRRAWKDCKHNQNIIDRWQKLADCNKATLDEYGRLVYCGEINLSGESLRVCPTGTVRKETKKEFFKLKGQALKKTMLREGMPGDMTAQDFYDKWLKNQEEWWVFTWELCDKPECK